MTTKNQMRFTVFHIGGGDDNIGPTNVLLELQGVDVDLYIFEIIEDEGYTRTGRFKDFPNVSVTTVPYGIGELDGEIVNFRVNKHPLSSSVLPGSKVTGQNNPDYALQNNWEENTEIDRTFDAKFRSIDALIASGEVPSPDFLSMDIQGLELAAMRGGTSAIAQTVLGIVTESEFAEIYEGQGLFHEQAEFLESAGFRLVDFETRQDWFFGPAVGKGFLTVVESLFFRHLLPGDIGRDTNARGFLTFDSHPPTQILKLALVAFAFERYSYFHYIISHLRDHEPELFSSLGTLGLGEYMEFFDRIEMVNKLGRMRKEYWGRNFHKIFSGLPVAKIKDKARPTPGHRAWQAFQVWVFLSLRAVAIQLGVRPSWRVSLGKMLDPRKNP